MIVHVIGITFIIMLLIILGLSLFVWYKYKSSFIECDTEQSTFCPTITCPYDDIDTSPCQGYAYRNSSS